MAIQIQRYLARSKVINTTRNILIQLQGSFIRCAGNI
jgi:hypothetical protein